MECLEKELSIKRYIYGDEHSQAAAVYKNVAKVKSVQIVKEKIENGNFMFKN